MTVSCFERYGPCDPAVNCRCAEFAGTSPEAARLIEETWDVFATGRMGAAGNELHFRILPYTAGEPNMGRVEAFLVRRACGSVWPRFTESHVFHLSDTIAPHLKRAALLAQYEVHPARTREEKLRMVQVLALGQEE